MLNIEERKDYRFALHHLGFRPFFLLAGLFAVASILAWLWIYHYNPVLPHQNILPAMRWHAHEMIYGYAMAVIAGFLLTAMRNWTNIQTLHGPGLLLLALLWLLARLAPFIDHPQALTVMATCDLAFNGGLCIALLGPIIKAKQWQQLAIWLQIVLIFTGNLLFYLGLFTYLAAGIQWSIYLGLYLVISLILIMGRRVIPFFIEKGVDGTVTLTNYRWLDISSVILTLLFLIIEVFTPAQGFSGLIALSLAVLHTIRLYGWYSHGIWQKPLLWILYIAYIWIVIGFSLTGLRLFFVNINPMLAIHAFAYGGIGMMTIGMMTRVSLGHTGRNVFDPPRILLWIFLLILAGSISRIVLAGLIPDLYSTWIGLSQLCWVSAFALFSWVYVPMFIKPRIDGLYG